MQTFIKKLQSQPVLDVLSAFNDALKIQDEASHKTAVSLADDLMTVINDDPDHALNPVLEMLMDRIEQYEQQHLGRPTGNPIDNLKFLLEEHGLKQADLIDIFGSQGNVSQVLSGKRKLNAEHIRALCQRFNVSPTVWF